MNKYKKLFNNSLIYAVGNLGTKLLILFLVPLYTYYLTTSEFGMVDLFTTTTSLLIPLITLSIFDSVFRFVMDKNYDKETVLINALIVTIIGITMLCALYPVMVMILPFKGYIYYFYLLLLVQSIFSTLSQYIRANGMVKLFAITGIINALFLLICNVLFLVIFHNGIDGYLQSLIIAYMVSSFFAIIVGKVYKDFKIKKTNIKIMKEMLHYSVPLIPNAMMWWIMSFSDRYIISFFLGLSANGLYALATKIPSILNIINSIFFQAWQMAAIEEVNSESKSKFFSNVFNWFSIIMLIAASLILVHLKIVVGFFVASEYFKSWEYVPFLLLGAVFSSFSGFLGTNYIAAKKTSGVFKTSVIGAVINMIANIILIPYIGINGASIGTMLSFAAIWLFRIYDTKKFVNIQINVKKILLSLIVIFIQIAVLYKGFEFEYLIEICLFMVLILVNYHEINILVVKCKQILFKRESNL
ncbi:lipopolysaccharide biosynthesis protein [Bacillus sp. es.036]|uniref:lipopolysaccharide biosynthesis protein n=1 Tax=Bacillus sp. es.036 TaxID=1761764 RepID=UPI000BF9C15E|nr:polysaccharide biosynthesis C-terminal domain-containing protein [Bacillus sp. es.036]PFG15089.1 O-antigen/teichoic acid export membrane protein [Bacillus sp. es.036]